MLRVLMRRVGFIMSTKEAAFDESFKVSEGNPLADFENFRFNQLLSLLHFVICDN